LEKYVTLRDGSDQEMNRFLLQDICLDSVSYVFPERASDFIS